MKKIIIIVSVVLTVFLAGILMQNSNKQDSLKSGDDVLTSQVANASQAPEITDSGFNLRGKPFTSSHEIALLDYAGDAMEPGISSDGQLLFFNSNGGDKNLFVAKRNDDFSYNSVRKLSEINSSSVDSSPEVVDESLFFTSLVNYPGNSKTLFIGEINGDKIQNVKPLKGNLYTGNLQETSLDPDVTANQEILFFVQGRFGGGSMPKAMDIQLAYHISGESYVVPNNSSEILKNINTDNLEYAPAISKDGRELFFTRATKSASGNIVKVEIMQATRERLSQSFGQSKVVSVADGFVEGPSLSADGKFLYYHKKVGDKFIIFVAKR